MNYKKLFLSISIFTLFFLFSFLFLNNTAHADPLKPTELTGWGWSSTIGHVSLNCKNTSTCGTSPGTSQYSVVVATSTAVKGDISGFAWSSNVGWIKFAGDASHPSPVVDLGTGAVTGWARVCSGTVNGDCTGAPRADGWDGWINLSDTDGANLFASPVMDGSRGITYDPTDGYFKGYSWGSNVVGWFKFDAYVPFGKSINIHCITGCTPGVPPQPPLDASCAISPSEYTIPAGQSTVVVTPTITSNRGAGGVTYTPVSWSLTEGTYSGKEVVVTDNYTPPQTVRATCPDFTVKKSCVQGTPGCGGGTPSCGQPGQPVCPGNCPVGSTCTPGLQMWGISTTEPDNRTVSSIRVKLGSPAQVQWDFVNATKDDFGLCVGRVGSTLLKGTEDIDEVPEDTAYTVPARLLPKGIHNFYMTCGTTEGRVFDASGAPTTVNKIEITVYTGSQIEER